MQCLFTGALLVVSFLLSVACNGEQGGVATKPSPTPTSISAAPASNANLTSQHPTDETVPTYTYEIVNSWPHDTKAYTQGLVFHDGHLYESTGQYGSSTLRKVELKSGKVKKKTDVSNECFAEGLAILQDRIFQLTWRTQKGFIYDLKNLKQQGEFSYTGEGWGLASDGQLLIMSDGSNQLYFRDPQSFQVVRTIGVFANGAPLRKLNELEYIKGEIYANIWQDERIVRIDPQSGKILAWIDLKGLRPQETLSNSENVLNGIAYDEEHDRLFVTGKRWPTIFEIRLKKK
jgi:glutamine cyclotransferase